MKYYRMRPFALRGVYSRAFVVLADVAGVYRAQRVFVWLMQHGVIAREEP